VQAMVPARQQDKCVAKERGVLIGQTTKPSMKQANLHARRQPFGSLLNPLQNTFEKDHYNGRSFQTGSERDTQRGSEAEPPLVIKASLQN